LAFQVGERGELVEARGLPGFFESGAGGRVGRLQGAQEVPEYAAQVVRVVGLREPGDGLQEPGAGGGEVALRLRDDPELVVGDN
jgi:hypothetical protein